MGGGCWSRGVWFRGMAPPPGEQTDTTPVIHYLPATLFAGGKILLHQNNLGYNYMYNSFQMSRHIMVQAYLIQS